MGIKQAMRMGLVCLIRNGNGRVGFGLARLTSIVTHTRPALPRHGFTAKPTPGRVDRLNSWPPGY